MPGTSLEKPLRFTFHFDQKSKVQGCITFHVLRFTLQIPIDPKEVIMLLKQNRRGQGYTEYVVLLAAVLAIAGIVVGTIQLVGNVFQRQQGRINALP